jgi:ketosteroid isomerase-like protein
MTQSELSKRTPQEVFGHHAQTLMAEDLDGILADYTDASYLVSPSGVLRGKNAIRGFFAELLRSLP